MWKWFETYFTDRTNSDRRWRRKNQTFRIQGLNKKKNLVDTFSNYLTLSKQLLGPDLHLTQQPALLCRKHTQRATTLQRQGQNGTKERNPKHSNVVNHGNFHRCFAFLARNSDWHTPLLRDCKCWAVCVYVSLQDKWTGILKSVPLIIHWFVIRETRWTSLAGMQRNTPVMVKSTLPQRCMRSYRYF